MLTPRLTRVKQIDEITFLEVTPRSIAPQMAPLPRRVSPIGLALASMRMKTPRPGGGQGVEGWRGLFFCASRQPREHTRHHFQSERRSPLAKDRVALDSVHDAAQPGGDVPLVVEA